MTTTAHRVLVDDVTYVPAERSYRFSNVQARLVWEYINHEGHWEIVTSQIGHNGQPYAARVMDKYHEVRLDHEGRADRRNLRIEMVPMAADWIDVAPSDDGEELFNRVADLISRCSRATFVLGGQ